MTVSLGLDKKEHVRKLTNQMLHLPYVTIRQLAQLIGTLVAAFPGVEFGPLHYRELEFTKIDALQGNYNYESKVLLSKKI